MTIEQEKAFLLRWIKELEEKLYTVRSLKAGAETGFGKIMQDNIKQKIDYLKQEYENCEYLEKIWKAVVDDKELSPEKDGGLTFLPENVPGNTETCAECEKICPYIYIKEEVFSFHPENVTGNPETGAECEKICPYVDIKE